MPVDHVPSNVEKAGIHVTCFAVAARAQPPQLRGVKRNMKTAYGQILLLLTVTAAAIVTAEGKYVSRKANQSPNIVFILADDMGIWASHTYGNPEIKTPNIDQLADEGLKFNNAFCNTPVCSASRTSYFTGTLSLS